MKKYIFFVAFLAVLFSGCSTKEVFEPKKVENDWEKYDQLKESIVDTSLNIAKLQNNEVLTKNGVLDITLDEDQRVLSLSDGWIISSSIDGYLILTSKDDADIQKNFELKKTVASASVQGDTLAVLFADNEMALYSVVSKEILFKEQGANALALNAKIVPPYFMNGLVIFLTLDGKVVVVNEKKRKRLRTVIVSSEDKFNNVIYFNIVDNKIVAATSYKILTMSQKDVRAKYEIRTLVYDDKNIYVATKQGEIISLNSNLQVNGEIKFPFAHFLGMISKEDKLYILEKEGYLIILDKNMQDYTIYEVDFDDGFVFVGDDGFYVDDEKILIE